MKSSRADPLQTESWADLLKNDRVHIHYIPLDSVSPSVEEHLTSEEKLRAERFSFSKDRIRFKRARGWLREWLSKYLERDADQIQLNLSATGKPGIQNADGPFFFNLSHSQDCVAAAFSFEGRVGVDIEGLDSRRAKWDLAAKIFSPEELQTYSALDPEQQTEAFFFIWTQKEAYLKADGLGIRAELNSIQVESDPRLPAELIRGLHHSASREWKLFSYLLERRQILSFATEVKLTSNPKPICSLERPSFL